MPRVIQSALLIDVPDGYRFADLDQFRGSGRSQFRSWSSRASQLGNIVNVEYEVHLAAGRHPAADYEQYYSDMNDSLAILRTPVTLQGQIEEIGTVRRPTGAAPVR